MFKKISVYLLWIVLLVQSGIAWAETSAAGMSFSELIAQAEYSIENSAPQDAIPVLREIITRAGGLDDRAAKESVQMARLQLGSSCAQLQQWAEARRSIEEYLAGDPIKERMAALQIMGQVAMAEGNWKELKSSAEQMLAENLTLKRKAVAEQLMLQALYHLGDYTTAIDMLPELIAQTKDVATIRTYRVMQLRCLFETGQTDKLITVLPVMFRGESREDIQLNLTLLHIGDQLFDRQKYRQALVVYRLVMPKADLMSRHEERLKKEEMAEDGSEPREFETLRQALEELREVPDYDVHISYRAAQIYSEQKRYWEAVVLFDQLYLKHPNDEQGLASYMQKVLLLYEINADDEAIADSVAFLNKSRSGLYPRMICSRLAQHYLNKQQLKKALELGPRFADHWTKATDADELAQETDLRYMFSFARFQLGEYKEAIKAFDQVIETSPKSQAAIDSNYWKAMCQLLQQNYEAAYGQFMHYRAVWPRASFAPAALFRAGVCQFGLEDYEGAKDLFKTFIADYPEDAQMPEALSMYADLLAADGLIDQALSHYERAMKIVVKNYAEVTDPILKKQMVAPATYAVLQAAQALKADAEAHAEQKDFQMEEIKYRLIINWMERYMSSFGENADWAQAVFWIGKAQIELGEPEKAVTAYLNTIIRRGTDPAQEGVASILFDLAGIIKNRLPHDQFEPTVRLIRDARASAESRTLQIRLDVLLADLDGTSDALGRTLLTQVKTLDEVPPSGLSMMCSALVAQNDLTRSKEFFDYFATHYENSPFRAASYQLRGLALYGEKNLDEAYELATDALGMYGATAETGWAQLVKGKVELARGESEKAAETLNMILSVRAWRGPICAEAMFRMAEAWEAQGNNEKAFAYFQRTYLLYKAYDGGRWAAEAYLRSAKVLDAMNRGMAARNTYRAMLLDEYVRDLPQAETAKQILGPEETAELIAGRTNTIETVGAEVAP